MLSRRFLSVWPFPVLILVLNASAAVPAAAVVTPGISVLVGDSLHLIRGKRVGLITNQLGRDERGRRSIDLIHRAAGVRLTAIFSPEHGIRGTITGGERVSSSIDRETGVPIYSLYGETLVPTRRMLANVDILVYDIQDVGARMYTYVLTMTLAAEVAEESGKKFIVLDRPDPIRADVVEGGMIENRYRSFTGLHDVPVRYGLTPGELARYLTGQRLLTGEILVVPMKGYRRSMWWDDTRLEWVKPSPNIRDPETALLYPGLSFFESTNVSEGRGTDASLRQNESARFRDAAASYTLYLP
ncbi:MAG: exo-beta-N-acetylmuramidase NamZ domain-containing protein [Gemmatimonadaceae bacterium]